MRRVLMVAFHFPPYARSSSVHRMMSFCTHLPRHGWEPIVLTVDPRAYPPEERSSITVRPDGIRVRRAWALDASRHLAVRGRYARWTALPDRWASWIVGAVPAGLALVRRHRPELLWSTYPTVTAHVVGALLRRVTGLPWVADFRDSMTEDGYPRDATTWRVWRRVERTVVARCARAVFTTSGARAMYASRYPEVPSSRWAVIPNGYDDESMRAAEAACARPDGRDRRVTLLHSGVLYRKERDPRAFFAALGDLRRRQLVSASALRVVLRASGDEAFYRERLAAEGIEDIVRLEPPIDYGAALQEMCAADGLLIFQGASCNHQVPAKVYEYLRSGRPVLALTDPAGDTATLLREAGAGRIVPLDDRAGIAAALPGFVRAIREGRERGADVEVVQRYSRQFRAQELAELFESVAGTTAAPTVGTRSG